MVRPGGGAFQKALSLPLLRVSLSQARGSPFFKKRPEYFPDSIPAKSTRQRAAQSIGLTAGTILREKLTRTFRQPAAHFPAFPFDPRNRHPVIGGRLMPHPRNDRRLGTLFQRNQLRPRDSAASDRNRMSRHGIGKLLRKSGPFFIKRQKLQNSFPELCFIFRLFPFPHPS